MPLARISLRESVAGGRQEINPISGLEIPLNLGTNQPT